MRPTLSLILALSAPIFLATAAATAQTDTRQVGSAPAAAGAPAVKRSPASPHPNCVRDKMGKCQPTTAAKKKAQSR